MLPVLTGFARDDAIKISVKSPDGRPTVRFTGTLRGDEIHFTRDVDVPAGAPTGGTGLFGARGVTSFVARRPEVGFQ